MFITFRIKWIPQSPRFTSFRAEKTGQPSELSSVGDHGFLVPTHRYYRGQLLLSFLRPTFDALLPPSLRALLGAESVAAAELSAEAVSVHCEVDNSEHRKIFVLTNIG